MDENSPMGSLLGNRTRVLCKFFAHGTCLKGEHCEFSHDLKDPANNICTFHHKGACAYGSRCRYDHVKVSRQQASTPSSSTNPHQYVVSESSQHNDLLDDGNVAASRRNKMAEIVMCSFAAVGNCPRGDNCPHIHGDLCQTCKKQCLHPFRLDEREEHIKSCEKKYRHLDTLKRSEEIECGVCLEHVLSKPTAAERKFGLLSECDHPFCISCIRNWRSSSPTSEMDVNSSLRACPICRKLSYFVIPSVIWYATKEEKQEIVHSYKARLRSIDCKHFDFGNGTCPFGTSCFYKHTVKPGSLLWNNLNDDDLEGESSGDELCDAIVAAEAMAFLQMHSGFQTEEEEEVENESEEGSDEEDTDDGSSDDGSDGEALAQAYLLWEMRSFLQMF